MASVRSRTVLERIEKIDRLLREEGGLTLARLAGALGVTERTVCRALDFMKRELGLPVAHSPGKAYHYASPVPPLDRLEVRRIAGLDPRGGPSKGTNRTRACLVALHQALYTRRRVLLRVLQGNEDEEALPFHPFFLSRIAGNLILFGYRPDTEALLNLPLRRIEGVEQLGETFEAWPVGESKVREGEGWFPPGGTHRVRLRFPARATWARELLLAEGQVLEDNAGTTVFTFETDDLERVRRVASLLGGSVRVEEPADLGSSTEK